MAKVARDGEDVAKATAPRRASRARVDTNLQGQRLGRKGRVTRERIIAAARSLLDDPDAKPLSLSAVAREAGLGMSSLYLYFKDMTELILAVLEPVVESSEETYVSLIREFWPDEELVERSQAFVHAFHGFWAEHSRLLHLRNAMADRHDPHMIENRIELARPVIRLLAQQMGAPDTRITGDEYDLASVLFTGLERVVTMATDDQIKKHFPPQLKPRFEGRTLIQEARVLRLAIQDQRAIGPEESRR